MKQHTQFSQEEGYEIYTTLKSKTSQAQIVRELNRSPVTISREIRCNQIKVKEIIAPSKRMSLLNSYATENIVIHTVRL